MPLRISQPSIGLSRIVRRSLPSDRASVCLLCAQSRSSSTKKPSRRPRTNALPLLASLRPPARYSTKASNPRKELQHALQQLEKHSSRFVNASRLQLALNGLQHPAGDEPIRIAILGLTTDGKSYETAKQLLRLILADPLKVEEEWEQILLQSKQTDRPVLVRVGYDIHNARATENRLIQELNVSSPTLNGHKVELLILGLDPAVGVAEEQFAEQLLVPAMEIPTSSTGRYTPVTTPVHKVLVVGDGLAGAATLAAFPQLDASIAQSALNIRLMEDVDTTTPFQIFDVSRGTAALQLFRDSVENAIQYEKEWFASGLAEVVNWVKQDTTSTTTAMKVPVRHLISTLLSLTSNAVEAEGAVRLAALLSQRVSSDDIASLRKELAVWAEQAHTELRDQLDVAFDGHRWRKLSWWKLFWRVDDVSMLSNSILTRNFLTDADKSIIYLAGQIAQAKDVERSAYDDPEWAYKGAVVAQAAPRLGDEPAPPVIETIPEPRHRVVKRLNPEWPVHIPLARERLQTVAVPALQALAQKLVLQTFTTSSFASIAAGLLYVSTISTGLYEAGAVAALGIVWSMRRMQGKWETARKFWEGEVREEGRKAVRGIEGVVNGVLTTKSDPALVDEEIEKARELVQRAEEALAKCK